MNKIQTGEKRSTISKPKGSLRRIVEYFDRYKKRQTDRCLLPALPSHQVQKAKKRSLGTLEDVVYISSVMCLCR